MSSFVFEDQNFATYNEMIAARVRLYPVAKRGMADVVETWTRRMKQQQFTGYKPGATQRKLRVRTGALRSSIGGRVIGTRLNNLTAKLRVGGGRAGYARIQEQGGVVRPKNRRYLTVPLANALRPTTGTLKPAAKIRKTAEGYTTRLGPTVILPGTRNPIVYARRNTKRGKGRLLPLYVLKTSVKIEPRLGAEDKLRFVLRQEVPKLTANLRKTIAGGKV